jgi:hypothetical protein
MRAGEGDFKWSGIVARLGIGGGQGAGAADLMESGRKTR